MIPTLAFFLLLSVHLGASVTNNNNNFGVGGAYDYMSPQYRYRNSASVHPYAVCYYRKPHRHASHSHSHNIVNNNGPYFSGKKTCPFGKIVNNNGPGDIQVQCLPEGVPSSINNNNRRSI